MEEMSVAGFEEKDFNTFTIEGLEDRMEAIQTRIQPKFKVIGEELVTDLSMKLGNELYLHIARHARRTVNPPNDTWLAICDNKRGYKKHPHFQVGLFDDRLFIWMALIYELPNKQKIATEFLNNFGDLKQLPNDFVVSLDHMKKDSISIDELETSHLERFRDVKKAEFLIGRNLDKEDSRVKDGDELLKVITATYDQLIPFYQLALKAR
jgi:uncharacterized protein YktB (UPF0637 family)